MMCCAVVWCVDPDNSYPYIRKCAFDVGDYGMGFVANSLQLGCDCLGHIKYFDGVVNNAQVRVLGVLGCGCASCAVVCAGRPQSYDRQPAVPACLCGCCITARIARMLGSHTALPSVCMCVCAIKADLTLHHLCVWLCCCCCRCWCAVVCVSQGEGMVIPNAICLHEEDAGLLWKHTDTRLGHVEVRRNRRLVISMLSTFANYEYGMFWYFYLVSCFGGFFGGGQWVCGWVV